MLILSKFSKIFKKIFASLKHTNFFFCYFSVTIAKIFQMIELYEKRLVHKVTQVL